MEHREVLVIVDPKGTTIINVDIVSVGYAYEDVVVAVMVDVAGSRYPRANTVVAYHVRGDEPVFGVDIHAVFTTEVRVNSSGIVASASIGSRCSHDDVIVAVAVDVTRPSDGEPEVIRIVDVRSDEPDFTVLFDAIYAAVVDVGGSLGGTIIVDVGSAYDDIVVSVVVQVARYRQRLAKALSNQGPQGGELIFGVAVDSGDTTVVDVDSSRIGAVFGVAGSSYNDVVVTVTVDVPARGRSAEVGID
jgi:hypothetical protein